MIIISKRLIIATVIGGLLLCYIVFAQMFVYDIPVTPQYLQDAGFEIKCSERFLQHPTRCKVIESDSGIVASLDMIQEAIPPDKIICWSETEHGHFMPCIINSGT